MVSTTQRSAASWSLIVPDHACTSTIPPPVTPPRCFFSGLPRATRFRASPSSSSSFLVQLAHDRDDDDVSSNPTDHHQVDPLSRHCRGYWYWRGEGRPPRPARHFSGTGLPEEPPFSAHWLTTFYRRTGDPRERTRDAREKPRLLISDAIRTGVRFTVRSSKARLEPRISLSK